MIGRLEAISRAAWPARESIAYDGWILCESGGYTRRTNSVHPVSAGELDLATKIAHCEAFYRGRGGRPVFKLTQAAAPPELEPELARRGYRLSDPTSVQRLDLRAPGLSFDPQPEVRIEAKLGEEWLAACMELWHVASQDEEALRGILERVSRAAEPCAFALLERADRRLALGLGVLRTGTVFLGEIVSAPDRRRQGLGRRVVESLLAWALEQSAECALLQVVAANTPACCLYRVRPCSISE